LFDAFSLADLFAIAHAGSMVRFVSQLSIADERDSESDYDDH